MIEVEIPEGIHFEYLPPYSPELQPAEHLWQLSDEPLVNRTFETLDELEATLTTWCVTLSAMPEVIGSTPYLLKRFLLICDFVLFCVTASKVKDTHYSEFSMRTTSYPNELITWVQEAFSMSTTGVSIIND